MENYSIDVVYGTDLEIIVQRSTNRPTHVGVSSYRIGFQRVCGGFIEFCKVICNYYCNEVEVILSVVA